MNENSHLPSLESLALALRNNNMATNLATVEAREVLRCDHCSLVQFRTANSLCRRCHKPLEIEEPEPLQPQLVAPSPESEAEGINVARAVRDMRGSKGLSQRQLAGRMGVPRTYISKIENGKAMPTLSSLERLARRARGGYLRSPARCAESQSRRYSFHHVRSLPGGDRLAGFEP